MRKPNDGRADTQRELRNGEAPPSDAAQPRGAFGSGSNRTVAARRKARNRVLQAVFLARSLEKRRAIVAKMREKSKEVVAGKPAQIMDVNAGAVQEAFRRHRVSRLVHGHTHRPGKHELEVDGLYCGGDLVGFIDATVDDPALASAEDPIVARRDALVAAFSTVHAVSAKLVAMTLAVLLMAGDRKRPRQPAHS